MSDPTSLADLAASIAKATRLRGATAVISAPSGREARICLDGRTLAFVRGTKSGIRVHVQHHGSEERSTVETVREAADLVKTSARRQPKPAAVEPVAEAA